MQVYNSFSSFSEQLFLKLSQTREDPIKLQFPSPSAIVLEFF